MKEEDFYIASKEDKKKWGVDVNHTYFEMWHEEGFMSDLPIEEFPDIEKKLVHVGDDMEGAFSYWGNLSEKEVANALWSLGYREIKKRPKL